MTERTIDGITKHLFINGPGEAVYEAGVRSLCLCRYPDHPRGCPNYGKRDDCSPKAPLFVSLFRRNVIVVAIGMDVQEFLEARREKHPDWSERALFNSRHWQGALRADLGRFIATNVSENPSLGNYSVILSPEAMGINVFATGEDPGIGLFLERTPKRVVYKVALLALTK